MQTLKRLSQSLVQRSERLFEYNMNLPGVLGCMS